ncbi:MAG: hypothetical protein VXW94_03415 [Pseudomonadota bacterium]|nr:hypothetical protein [Pseudomonadota bacterium]
MTQRCLYVGDKLSSEMMMQLIATDGGVVQVTRLSTALTDPMSTSLQLELGSVEGQSRLLDWLRQNDPPTRILCELQAFEFVTSDAGDTRSASDYLSAQIIGITRILEAALSLNPELRWVFLKPPVADVWSDASEAYFRVLVEGLRIAAPSARFDFLLIDKV